MSQRKGPWGTEHLNLPRSQNSFSMTIWTFWTIFGIIFYWLEWNIFQWNEIFQNNTSWFNLSKAKNQIVLLSDLFLSLGASVSLNKKGFFMFRSMDYHGTIIQTGIACNKIPCYMRDSLASSVLLKKLKNFEVMFNIFWILPGVRHCRIFICLCI